MHRRNYFCPYAWNFLMMMTFIITPSVKYKLSIEDKLSWTADSWSTFDSSFHPKLTLVSRRRLTYFITKVFNNVKGVLFLIFLRLFFILVMVFIIATNYSRLACHIHFTFAEADENRLNRNKFSIAFDFLPSNYSMWVFNEKFKL